MINNNHGDRSPEKMHMQRTINRKTKAIVGLTAILAAELFLGNTIRSELNEQNINTRLNREIAIRQEGTIEFENGVYTGETDFGIPSGVGQFQFETGATYSGDLSEGDFEGLGVLKNPEKGSYDGEFKDSMRHGTGTYTWSDGTVYSGSWINDMMSGDGEYKTVNGLSYVGKFKNNAFEYGECTFSNETGTYDLQYKDSKIDSASIVFKDGTTYSGEINRNDIEGTGTLNYSEGDVYEGNFETGEKKGQGTYTWASGSTYVGGWLNDEMSGTGIYTFKNGSVAEGTFEHNRFTDGSFTVKNTFGEYIFKIKSEEPVNIEIHLEDGTEYSGDMLDGKLGSSALISYGNGDTYDGSMSNGKKSGTGTYTWANGAAYTGDWADDKMHGSGTYKYPSSQSGFQLVGTFENGVPNGKCKYYTSSSKSFETDWENGVCVKIYE